MERVETFGLSDTHFDLNAPEEQTKMGSRLNSSVLRGRLADPKNQAPEDFLVMLLHICRRIFLAGCSAAIVCAGAVRAQDRFITVASTTSTEQSGLFDYILPLFQKESGINVRVVAVGTGQALAIGARGDADALLVHD